MITDMRFTKKVERALVITDRDTAFHAAGIGTGVWGNPVFDQERNGWMIRDRETGLLLADPAKMPKRRG